MKKHIKGELLCAEAPVCDSHPIIFASQELSCEIF